MLYLHSLVLFSPLGREPSFYSGQKLMKKKGWPWYEEEVFLFFNCLQTESWHFQFSHSKWNIGITWVWRVLAVQFRNYIFGFLWRLVIIRIWACTEKYANRSLSCQSMLLILELLKLCNYFSKTRIYTYTHRHMHKYK